MLKFYLLSKNDVQPVVWDGKTRFEVKPGVRILTETEFEAWTESDDGKTLPPYDPATEAIELDVLTLKYVKRKATPEEVELHAVKTERQQLRTILAALKAGNATGPQVQRVLAFVLERIVA